MSAAEVGSASFADEREAKRAEETDNNVNGLDPHLISERDSSLRISMPSTANKPQEVPSSPISRHSAFEFHVSVCECVFR